jgi:Astacin (Peptidase family M12A)
LFSSCLLVFLSLFALVRRPSGSLRFHSFPKRRKNSWNRKKGLKKARARDSEGPKTREKNSIYFTGPEFISTIYESMSSISNRSCIRFTPRTSHHKNYIYITKGPGCSSEGESDCRSLRFSHFAFFLPVGMRHTGEQLMNINEELCSRGKIIHELLHSLGFLHMHTAK